MMKGKKIIYIPFLSLFRVKNTGAYKSNVIQLTKYLILFFKHIVRKNLWKTFETLSLPNICYICHIICPYFYKISLSDLINSTILRNYLKTLLLYYICIDKKLNIGKICEHI